MAAVQSVTEIVWLLFTLCGLDVIIFIVSATAKGSLVETSEPPP